MVDDVQDELNKTIKEFNADKFAIALDGLMYSASKWSSTELMFADIRKCLEKRYGSPDVLDEFLNLAVHEACKFSEPLKLTKDTPDPKQYNLF